MHTAIKSSCACNCNPCSCPSTGGVGCLDQACPPRPCFFDGQLVTAEDLNALVTYVRTKDALLARLVGGWGILGGLRVDAGPGAPHRPLVANPLSPNPQIVAGTTLTIGAGSAIDARGHVLTACAPLVVDALQLARSSPASLQDRTCADWFPGRASALCGGDSHFAAEDYLVVAVERERPARPVAQLAGGGACDPAASCDFSRTLEQVEIRLVPTASVDLGTYVLTGCLDRIALPWQLGFEPKTGQVILPTLPVGVTRCELIDALNELLLRSCCERPAVVLGRVLLTAFPDKLSAGLPQVPLYTIIQDFLPVRRVIAANALQCLLAGALPAEPVEPVIGRTGGTPVLRGGGPA